MQPQSTPPMDQQLAGLHGDNSRGIHNRESGEASSESSSSRSHPRRVAPRSPEERLAILQVNLMASGNACAICGSAEGLKFPSCCRNPICSSCMPNLRATQRSCATCRAALGQVQWFDAVAALDLHRRIADAMQAEAGHEEEPGDARAEDEEIRGSPQFKVIRSLIQLMLNQRPGISADDRGAMMDLEDEERIWVREMVDRAQGAFIEAENNLEPILPDAGLPPLANDPDPLVRATHRYPCGLWISLETRRRVLRKVFEKVPGHAKI
jgi:hypothetical protein